MLAIGGIAALIYFIHHGLFDSAGFGTSVPRLPKRNHGSPMPAGTVPEARRSGRRPDDEGSVLATHGRAELADTSRPAEWLQTKRWIARRSYALSLQERLGQIVACGMERSIGMFVVEGGAG